MRMRVIHAAAIVTIGLTAMACGASPAGRDDSRVAEAKPAVPLTQLFLEPQDIAPGSERRGMPLDDVVASIDLALDSYRYGNVEPPNCTEVMADAGQRYRDVLDAGQAVTFLPGPDAVGATDPESILQPAVSSANLEILADTAFDVDRFRQALEECPSVSGELIVKGKPSGTLTTREYTILPVPEGLAADQAMIMRVHSVDPTIFDDQTRAALEAEMSPAEVAALETMSSDRPPIDTTVTFAFAVVRGLTIVLIASEHDMERTLELAVQKVRDAR
jgi:hypothetical protein